MPAWVLPPKTRVDYVSPQQLHALFDEGRVLDRGWDHFYEEFPGASALTSFSPVGFSTDGRQALFAVHIGCGGLCGRGIGVLMRRNPLGWSVEKQQDLWIS